MCDWIMRTSRISAGRGWVTGILGLWVIIAGFVPALESGSALLWDNLIVGVAIAITAVAASGHRSPQVIPHAR